MTEFELISRLLPSLPTNPTVVIGAGDDCAVLDLGLPERLLLLKTDAVVEGIHFATGTSGEQIGHKALARCLSDIAAMAGTPTAALVTLGLPGDFDPKVIEAIYSGMARLARSCEVAIVGGETTTNPERLLISISALGWVTRGKAALRSGAKPGDAIFVTGELGGSLAGKHLTFEPRLAEARWLTEHFQVHSMMDISDGLAGDLRHILNASGVGAELLASAIPISREARRTAGARVLRHQSITEAGLPSRRLAEAGVPAGSTPPPKSPLLAALTDGEDFELLLTVAGKEAVPLLDAWNQQFSRLRLSCIGKITEALGLQIHDKHGLRTLEAKGYEHFSK